MLVRLFYIVPGVAMLLCLSCFSRRKAMHDVIRSERAFAKYAASHTTRDAFIQFFDTASVAFSKGNAVNGYQLWSDRAVDSSLLLWGPAFAAVSSGGNFGITVGPSEYRTGRSSGSQSYFGHFASVWKRNGAHQWKVLCDIGIGHAQHEGLKENTETLVVKHRKLNVVDTTLALLLSKQLPSSVFANLATSSQQLHEQAWLLLEGSKPFRAGTWDQTRNEQMMRSQFQQTGHWFAPVHDLLAVYGNVRSDTTTGNYLAVWAYDHHTWRLLLLAIAGA